MDKNQKDTRPPIVTIMGHVDHGKTTLLDVIRKTNVAAHEHGNITQHIGAYQIIFQKKPITFIDTPGHAAFEKMRFRGAEVADIVVLVVAANDGVKPQTIEAIKHIKRAQRPMIVAITKTDLENINIEKVKKQLQVEGVVVESYGGDIPALEIAAPKNKGVTELLEMIQILWELSPQPNLSKKPLEAVVVESFLDKRRGPVVTVIVKEGTLAIGQKIMIDSDTITVKALIDDNGQNIQKAEPGQPVELLGFKKVLDVGTVIREHTTTALPDIKPLAIGDIIAKTQELHRKFKVIIKADVTGSLEAILGNLPKNLLVVLSGVGEIAESDIAFAKVTNAPILAFNIKLSSQMKSLAEREGVVIKNYNVIYGLLSDLEEVTQSFQQAKAELKISGRAKIIASFDIEGKKIAGALVTHGKLKINDNIILQHQGKSMEAKIVSLKRFKKDVQTVTGGQDCGIGFSPELDFSEGDIIESLG